jgi:integrase/recombinase XerD
MMNALIPVVEDTAIVTASSTDLFRALIGATLETVTSSSARVYRQTFEQWHDWCIWKEVNPLALYSSNVGAYLLEQAVSQSTRQRQLSALRKMARVLATLDYNNLARRAAYDSLLLLRAPKEGAAQNERTTRALSPTQAIKVLNVWEGKSLIHQRNHALISLLFLTGLRRSEAAVLRWSDLNLEEGTLQVRHGKGDVARTAAIAGEAAMNALKAWQTALFGIAGERLFVFCAIGKGSKLGPDTAMTDQAVYHVIKQTQKKSGVIFSPHDARRTFITEALTTGATLADVQAQAGHKQESTTLRYAKSVDALQRRQRLRLRYGDE